MPSAKVEAAVPGTILEPTWITVLCWGRLQDGELLAKSRTIDWATMMERTWVLDAKKCARCGGRLRVLATITDPEVIKKIQDHLHVRSSPLVRAPPQGPGWAEQSFRYEHDAEYARIVVTEHGARRRGAKADVCSRRRAKAVEKGAGAAGGRPAGRRPSWVGTGDTLRASYTLDDLFPVQKDHGRDLTAIDASSVLVPVLPVLEGGGRDEGVLPAA
ncbi:MAG: hypothetical protein U0359_07985 [Byssovorax sp.]